MTAGPSSGSGTAVAEPRIPTVVSTDRTLRVKIIDSCGMACTFCHNEGTPVAVDNPQSDGAYLSRGPSGRVSIYVNTNGARFVPTTVEPDAALTRVLIQLREGLDLD